MQGIIKILAAAFVICGSSGMGHYYSSIYKECIKELQDFYEITNQLKQEIDYGHVTFLEACRLVSLRVPEPYSAFLQQVHNRMNQKKGINVMQIWQEELMNLQKELHLPPQMMEIMAGVIETDNCYNREMQLHKMEMQSHLILEEIEKRKAEQTNKCKIYLSIGIMSGILCSVILV
ncbi:MAG: stage III sporulation protein AB [Lachnospiraceae bacterium]|nr:stage III sporulation protein AB [Lachnospiraceae bacterium]